MCILKPVEHVYYVFYSDLGEGVAQAEYIPLSESRKVKKIFDKITINEAGHRRSKYIISKSTEGFIFEVIYL